MGFGQPQFPRDARVFDAGLRRSASAAVVAANQHHISVRFGHAGGDGSHADFGDQLDADAGVVI